MSLADRVVVTEVLDRWLRDTRRMIHMQPELLLDEEVTSELVRKHLTEIGVPFRARVGGDGRSLYTSHDALERAGIKTRPVTGGTGVLGEVKGTRGAGPGKTILLRADMDALPLTELNDVPYKSQVPGKMHACGHDLHTTVLMGVAEVLSGLTDTFDGTVKFMFQPAEEGAGGAAAMIHDGIMENPPVDAAFALHVSTDCGPGQISVNTGPSAASADMIEIHITGKGGHAAFPHTTVDTTLVAAHIMIALQTLVAREVSPMDTAVVSIGKLESGTIHNIIPHTASMLGTVRTYNEDVRDFLEKRITEIVPAIAAAFRAEAEVVYLRGYPAMVNDAERVERARAVRCELLGADNVLPGAAMMAGEDMAFVLQKVPGCLFSLGVGNPDKGFISPPHHPRFDADEDALAVGVRMLSGIALRYLQADV